MLEHRKQAEWDEHNQASGFFRLSFQLDSVEKAELARGRYQMNFVF